MHIGVQPFRKADLKGGMESRYYMAINRQLGMQYKSSYHVNSTEYI